jgi:hypothetical protein
MANHDRRSLEAGEVESPSFAAGFIEGYQKAMRAAAKSKSARAANYREDAVAALKTYTAEVKKAQEEEGMIVFAG